MYNLYLEEKRKKEQKEKEKIAKSEEHYKQNPRKTQNKLHYA